MDFSDALDDLKDGVAVTRRGWNGKGMKLALLEPEPGVDIVTSRYIAIYTADGSVVPWTASQTDLLGNDWEPVDE